MTFLNLADVKAQLGVSASTYDSELGDYMDGVTAVVQDVTGEIVSPVTGQTVTMTFPGSLTIPARPVTNVTSVVDAVTGETVDPSLYEWDALGQVTSSYLGKVTVTYDAGWPTAPANYVLAGLIIVQHLWETKRGNMPMSAAELVDSLGVNTRTGTLVGFAIPNKALELLGNSPRTAIGFA